MTFLPTADLSNVPGLRSLTTKDPKCLTFILLEDHECLVLLLCHSKLPFWEAKEYKAGNHWNGTFELCRWWRSIARYMKRCFVFRGIIIPASIYGKKLPPREDEYRRFFLVPKSRNSSCAILGVKQFRVKLGMHYRIFEYSNFQACSNIIRVLYTLR